MKIIKENSKEWEKKEGYSKNILLSEGIIIGIVALLFEIIESHLRLRWFNIDKEYAN